MSSYRPRRTRLYGASYDIGESYYKKQLDNLDRKKYSETHSSLRAASAFGDEPKPRVSFLNDVADDLNDDILSKYPTSKALLARKANILDDLDTEEPLSYLKQRAATVEPSAIESRFAERMKRDASFFDGLGTQESSRYADRARKDLALFDDSVNETTSRLSERRKKDLSFLDTPRKSAVSSLLHDSANEIDEGITVKRSWKLRTENVAVESNAAANQASSRMLASKARLADLESEMQCITDKQAEREKRKSGLRKLLAESNSDSF